MGEWTQSRHKQMLLAVRRVRDTGRGQIRDATMMSTLRLGLLGVCAELLILRNIHGVGAPRLHQIKLILSRLS